MRDRVRVEAHAAHLDAGGVVGSRIGGGRAREKRLRPLDEIGVERLDWLERSVTHDRSVRGPARTVKRVLRLYDIVGRALR